MPNKSELNHALARAAENIVTNHVCMSTTPHSKKAMISNVCADLHCAMAHEGICSTVRDHQYDPDSPVTQYTHSDPLSTCVTNPAASRPTQQQNAIPITDQIPE